MSEIESCNLESIGKGRKKVAGAPKSAKKRINTGRGKSTKKIAYKRITQ